MSDLPVPVLGLHQMSLDQAQEVLRAHLRPLVSKGATCPCCNQYVKIYKRLITGAMGYGLLLLVREDLRRAGRPIHVEDYLKSLQGIPSSIRGDISKLCWWGLLERVPGERGDGSRRVGLYRVLPAGRRFAEGRMRVPKYAKVYNNRVLSLHGQQVTISEVLGTKFDYRAICAAGHIPGHIDGKALFDPRTEAAAHASA